MNVQDESRKGRGALGAESRALRAYEALAAAATALAGADESVAAVIEAGLLRLSQALGVAAAIELAGGTILGDAAACLPSGWSCGLPPEAAAGQAGARLWLSAVPPRALWPALSQHLAAAVSTLARSRAAEETRERLRESEENLARRTHLMQGLFDVAPVGVVLIEAATGKVVEVNAAFLGFGEWEKTDVVGQPIDGLLGQGAPGGSGIPDQTVAIYDIAFRALASKERFGPVERRFYRPDGSFFPAILRGVALPLGRSRRRLIWLLVEDVSSQHASLAKAKAHRDEALHAREELATAFEALPYGMILFDAEDRVVLCNDRIRRIFPGLDDMFVSGQRHVDILTEGTRRGIFPEAQGKEADFIGRICDERRKPYFERLTELRDGRLIRVIEQAIPSGGRIGLRIDVTEEYEAARRLADVIDGSQAGTWEVDLTTGANVINDRWASMLGHTVEGLGPITTDVWKSLIHPSDVELVSQYVDDMLTGRRDQYDHVYRMRHAEGHWVWIADRGRVSGRDDAGKPTRMAGVHLDISAVKSAEQRLEDIIEGAQVGTWQLDTTTRENRINERWAAMLGYRLEELVPMNREKWAALVHPDDFRDLLAQERRVLSTENEIFQNEIRLRHKDGHWVWILSRGRVTAWGENAEPLMLSGVHIDISARKQLEAELEAERDFLSQLMETSVSGIIAFDADSRIIFCNAEVSRQLEVPAEALIGQICDPQRLNLTDAQGRAITLDDMPCRMAMRALGGVVQQVRLRLNLPDGRVKVFSVNAAQAPNHDQLLRVVATVTDVTDSVNAEERWRAASERAEAANRAKSQFLANMSHELRTPLNGVLGMAELLGTDRLSPDQSEKVETIRDSATLLLSIVNDILDLAKVESGNLKLERMPVNLARLAGRVASMHRVGAERKGIGLTLETDEGLEAARMGDGQRLLQVMHNVLGNAVKFTEAGEVRMHLDQPEAGQVRIRISDTGIGMTEEEMSRVFEEFTQADGTITRRFGGTGLGLSIVRRLVGLMGGEVGLASVKGAGTTVTITLPMQIAEGQGAGAFGAAPGPLPPPASRPLRILAAEDNRTNQMILRAMLDRMGHQVTLVSDGDEAVQGWQPGAFDVLLLDISMPRKDGVTALHELLDRAGAEGQVLPPAVAVTANAMTHLVEDYLAAGFAAVAAKPIRMDDLARALSQATGATAD